jgi:hypothetical protein
MPSIIPCSIRDLMLATAIGDVSKTKKTIKSKFIQYQIGAQQTTKPLGKSCKLRCLIALIIARVQSI